LSSLKNLKEASSLDDLAAILGYKPSSLSYLVYKMPQGTKYTKFTIAKKGRGEREISAPEARLKALQRRLANVLYTCRDQIDAENNRRSLSHGFRKKHSIITNARRHKRRRYVLNLDLHDFFPSFNFGRVRGFFIHNNNFKLNQKVATIIAQIACHENALPQGSPCSPIIADLIAHLLDVRLAQLAKQSLLTYSRYADDLTFSTSQRTFPASIAKPAASDGGVWTLGEDLLNAIKAAGFAVNPAKTRMQFRMSRQLVTGLTVNAKVNIRPEYYRSARAMCHSLFETGAYHRPIPAGGQQQISSLGPIEGILSHIHHVKDSIDERKELDKKKKPTAARQLYVRFLAYRYFVRLERPLIVCEGKTDNVYLKHAIAKLPAFQPKLGAWDGNKFTSAVSFFSYGNKAHRILDLGGGASDLKFFFIPFRFQQLLDGFKHRPLKHPVIVLIDNDNGANEIFSTLRTNYKLSIDIKSAETFFHVAHNLYLVKTPAVHGDGSSCIEDFFPQSLLDTKLEGKTFNPSKEHGAAGEYGKFLFAEKVVRANADTIDFSGFTPLLERISSVIDHYRAPAGP
jgi:RNA-directed DNA polymerase